MIYDFHACVKLISGIIFVIFHFVIVIICNELSENWSHVILC